MDIHECFKTRRSIRKYTEDKVHEEKIRKVLEAVQWAPSWVNVQPWEIVLVDDPDVQEKLQECVPPTNPGRKAVTMAPLLMVVCGKTGKSGYYNEKKVTVHGDWVMFDIGIACQNLCLAAWAQGLGTLHLGLLDHAKAAKVLGLPDDINLYEIILIGVPGKVGKAPPRKNIEDFIHKNKFGG
jgi:nitroreductase